MMSGQWYVWKEGQVFGPSTREELLDMLRRETISLEDTVGESPEGPWRQLGSQEWVTGEPRPIGQLRAMSEDDDSIMTTGNETSENSRSLSRRKVIGIVIATVVVTIMGLGVVGNYVEPEKPVLPVGVTIRGSLLGTEEGGWVVQFRNQTDKELQLYLIIKDESGRRSKDMNLFLTKYETKELGWLEGWQFQGGETITIQHPEYKQANWTISE